MAAIPRSAMPARRAPAPVAESRISCTGGGSIELAVVGGLRHRARVPRRARGVDPLGRDRPRASRVALERALDADDRRRRRARQRHRRHAAHHVRRGGDRGDRRDRGRDLPRRVLPAGDRLDGAAQRLRGALRCALDRVRLRRATSRSSSGCTGSSRCSPRSSCSRCSSCPTSRSRRNSPSTRCRSPTAKVARRSGWRSPTCCVGLCCARRCRGYSRARCRDRDLDRRDGAAALHRRVRKHVLPDGGAHPLAGPGFLTYVVWADYDSPFPSQHALGTTPRWCSSSSSSP